MRGRLHKPQTIQTGCRKLQAGATRYICLMILPGPMPVHRLKTRYIV